MSERELPVLTITAISKYDCPYRFYLSVVRLLRPVIKREALIDGIIHHLGREMGMDAMLAEIDRLVPVYGQEDADRKEIKTAMHMGMLKGALVYFEEPPDTVNEFEWCLPLVNPDTGRFSRQFQIAGKGDKVSIRAATVWETKTRGASVTKSDIDKLPLDRQVNNAVSGVQRSTGVTINEVRYQYVRKPSIQVKKNESIRQYCDRLREDYANPERRDFYFHEERLFIDQTMVTQWERDLWAIAHQIAYSFANNYWPHNSSRCNDWGSCEYLPLCRGENVEGFYQVEEPNPELQEVSRIGLAKREDEAA